MLSGGTVVAELELALPDPPGLAIRTLQVVAPIEVSGRRVEVPFTFTNIPLP
jgi:hypothetical protein